MYYFVGALMTIIMTLGISENFTILYTYFTNRKIRTVDNLFIVGIALSDIGQAILGVPFVVISSFSKRWIFGLSTCQYYAFITTFLGISQVAMLTSLAVDRYFIIVRSNRKLSNSYFRCTATITFSFLYGLVWATGPLVGWSGYEEEIKGIACSVSWEIQDANNLSYTISLFTFGWFIPLLLIGFGYISIALTIYKDRILKRHLRVLSMKKRNRDRKVAVTVLLMIGAFVATWLPYSVVSMWSVAGNFKDIPTWAQVAPAVFAKCSIIWNPIIYVARHSTFRRAVTESIKCFNNIPFLGEKCKYNHSGKTKISFNAMFNRQSKKGRNGTDKSFECFTSTSDNNKSCNGISTTKFSRVHNDTCMNLKVYERTKARGAVSNLVDIIELFPMATYSEDQCPSQTLEKAINQDNAKRMTKNRVYTQSVQDINMKTLDDHLEYTTEDSNNVPKIHMSSQKELSNCVSGALSLNCCVTSESDQQNRELQNPFCARQGFCPNLRSEDTNKRLKDDRSVSRREAVRLRILEQEQEDKLDILDKQRLKVRTQLACLYSELYRRRSLRGQHSVTSPPVIDCHPKVSGLDDKSTRVFTYASNPSKCFVNHDKSRGKCKYHDVLSQATSHSCRLSQVCKESSSNSCKSGFAITHNTNKYRNNVSKLTVVSKSNRPMTRSDKMYSEVDPLCKTCVCTMNKTSLSFGYERKHAQHELVLGHLKMMSNDSSTNDILFDV